MTSYNCICWFRVLSNQNLAILAFFFACVPAVLLASIRSCTGNTGKTKNMPVGFAKGKKNKDTIQRSGTTIHDQAGPSSTRSSPKPSAATQPSCCCSKHVGSAVLCRQGWEGARISSRQAAHHSCRAALLTCGLRHGLGVGQRSSNFSDSDFLSKNSLSVALLVPASATPEFSQCSCSCQ